jgi:hypothetical protein
MFPASTYGPDSLCFLRSDQQLALFHPVAKRHTTAHPHALGFGYGTLSRTHSAMTSRSNWAKDKRTLSVRRPIALVVLNAWVTLTKEVSAASSTLTILAKARRVKPEEARAGPVRAGNCPGDRSERGIGLTAIVEPGLEHDDLMDFAMPCARQPGARFDAGGCCRPCPRPFRLPPRQQP